MNERQCTYHIPVVLEYFKVVTEAKSGGAKEGFKIYFVSDGDDKIYLGTIKDRHRSDSILSLLIGLSQNCGALNHRCSMLLEQQYVTAVDENALRDSKSEQNELAFERDDAVKIATRLLAKYPDLFKWIANKPNYHRLVQKDEKRAVNFLHKLIAVQAEWKDVIGQIVKEMEAEEGGAENEEEYVGSDEFVSALLMVTVYLSKAVFVKRNILRQIKHIKAFDALLDILSDRDEVIGLTEAFPLPINDKAVNRQHVREFDTGALYERLRPKWNKMCDVTPGGMNCVLWDYQRKAAEWMLSRELQREMVPNLLWRPFLCQYEDIDDPSNNKEHKFWYEIDKGCFDDNDDEAPKLMDVRGGILADQMGLGLSH